MVMVKWLVHSPSTPTMPLKPTFFGKIFVEQNENKLKEAVVGLLLMGHHASLILPATLPSGFQS